MRSFLAFWGYLANTGRAGLRGLVAAFKDPRRRERTALLALMAYTAVWTLYAVVEKSSQDIHFDMAEVVAWARELALGGPKHPQLAAWIAALWFAIFPYQDWAYYLLAVASATTALGIAWHFSRHWLPADKRVAGLALLTLLPFFNFLAIKFNVNAVLVPFWALTTYCFLISYSTRNLWLAALAGIGAGACMLGKYWSIFLIAGLAIAALADPRRRAYFHSWAPWVTIAAGALVIAPHVSWLVEHEFSAFAYPLQTHGGRTLSFAVEKSALYLLGFLAYLAPALVAFWLVARPDTASIREILWPRDTERRLVALAFWTPVVLPIPVALFLRTDLTPIWLLPAASLLPVLLLSSPRLTLTRRAVAAVLTLSMILPLSALMLSPGIAVANHLQGAGNAGEQYQSLAEAMQQKWRQTTHEPLRFVGGSSVLANGLAFYLPDRPVVLNIVNPSRTPWVDEARVKQDGIALVCRTTHQRCLDSLDVLLASAPAGHRMEVTVARRFLGLKGIPQRYVVAFITPASVE